MTNETDAPSQLEMLMFFAKLQDDPSVVDETILGVLRRFEEKNPEDHAALKRSLIIFLTDILIELEAPAAAVAFLQQKFNGLGLGAP